VYHSYGIRPALIVNLSSSVFTSSSSEYETLYEPYETPVTVTAKPGDAKDMALGTWTGAGGHRWLKFGKHIWRVLDVYSYKGRKQALLLAEEPVAFMKFDSSSNDWNTSDIMGWLNNVFCRGALSEDEQSAIVPRTYRYGGWLEENDETDSSRIFLLSINEASDRRYFAGDADQIAFHRDNEGSLKKVSWWLCSPGYYDNRAAIVHYNSIAYIDYYYYAYDLVDSSYGIRPALVVNLSSPIFTSSSSKYETLYELDN
jgi:hypothetical protein